MRTKSGNRLDSPVPIIKLILKTKEIQDQQGRSRGSDLDLSPGCLSIIPETRGLDVLAQPLLRLLEGITRVEPWREDPYLNQWMGAAQLAQITLSSEWLQ